MSGLAGLIKPWARYARAGALRAGGQLGRREAAQADALTILCYHRVLPARQKRDYFIPDLAVTPAAFAGQCRALRERFDLLPLAEAVEAWRTGGCRPRPLAAITFDDGYRDNYVHARPVLEALGLRATFFVVTGLVDSDDLPWYDHLGLAAAAQFRGPHRSALDARLPGAGQAPLRRATNPAAYARAVVEQAKALAPPARAALVAEAAAWLPRPPADPDLDRIMTIGQLRSLHASGHEVASHTHTHPLLHQLEAAEIGRELCDSRDAIADWLGGAPRSFCYPNGDYDDRVLRAVAEAGYGVATTTREGANPPGADPLTLARVFVHEGRLSRPWGGVSTTLLRLECAATQQPGSG